MARIILITGGCRSGKSRLAQEKAEKLPGCKLFVATCPPLDAEMRARIQRHQREREARGWLTAEEELDLAGLLASRPEAEVVLVDCLTLWVNNLLFTADCQKDIGEDEMSAAARVLVEACRRHPGTVLLVTNEVGMGIVPENALARSYRDLVGRCNQVVAAAADEVYLAVCGLPLPVKTSGGG